MMSIGCAIFVSAHQVFTMQIGPGGGDHSPSLFMWSVAMIASVGLNKAVVKILDHCDLLDPRVARFNW